MNKETIETQAKAIENQQAEQGWDAPAHMIVVAGVEEAPVLIVAPEFMTMHPIPHMMGLYDAGVRMNTAGVLGIGFLFESWRHLTFEEAMVTEGHPVKKAYDDAMRIRPTFDGEPFDEEAVRPTTERVWQKIQLEMQPSMMEPHLRMESRDVVLVFAKDTYIYSRSRNDGTKGEESFMSLWNTPGEDGMGQVDLAARRFLNGQNPAMDEGDYEKFIAFLRAEAEK